MLTQHTLEREREREQAHRLSLSSLINSRISHPKSSTGSSALALPSSGSDDDEHVVTSTNPPFDMFFCLGVVFLPRQSKMACLDSFNRDAKINASDNNIMGI